MPRIHSPRSCLVKRTEHLEHVYENFLNRRLHLQYEVGHARAEAQHIHGGESVITITMAGLGTGDDEKIVIARDPG